MAHNNKLQKNRKLMNSGFGLIELMVSIGIVVLVMGIIVSKHSSYNGAVLLRSQAYSVALQAREIQLSAVSPIETGSLGYRNVLGLHFNTATPDFYYNFRDSDNDYFFDAGEELGRRNNIDSRFEIDDIRLVGSATTPSSVSVVFERPNFDARFFTSAGTEPAGVTAVEIDIRLKGTTGSGVGDVRTVEITRTGQIIVKDYTPTPSTPSTPSTPWVSGSVSIVPCFIPRYSSSCSSTVVWSTTAPGSYQIRMMPGGISIVTGAGGSIGVNLNYGSNSASLMTSAGNVLRVNNVNIRCQPPYSWGSGRCQ